MPHRWKGCVDHWRRLRHWYRVGQRTLQEGSREGHNGRHQHRAWTGTDIVYVVIDDIVAECGRLTVDGQPNEFSKP